MSLKEFIPPVVVDFIKKSRKVIKYDTYEEALAQSSSNAYENEELCNMIADKTLAYIDTLQRKPLPLKPASVYMAFTLNYVVNSLDKRNITVLDFGGACGAHYFEARNMIPDEIKLNWIVVETEQMVKSAISRGLAKGELRFASRIEDVTDAVDFVHSSSTLQYVPAPIDFLNRLIACNASAMLFNRMLFNKHDGDIITVQRSLLSANGPGSLPPGYADREIRYPHTAIAIGKVMAAMQAGGYDCFSEFEETSGKISLGKEDVLAKGLLFLQHS